MKFLSNLKKSEFKEINNTRITGTKTGNFNFLPIPICVEMEITACLSIFKIWKNLSKLTTAQKKFIRIESQENFILSLIRSNCKDIFLCTPLETESHKKSSKNFKYSEVFLQISSKLYRFQRFLKFYPQKRHKSNYFLFFILLYGSLMCKNG